MSVRYKAGIGLDFKGWVYVVGEPGGITVETDAPLLTPLLAFLLILGLRWKFHLKESRAPASPASAPGQDLATNLVCFLAAFCSGAERLSNCSLSLTGLTSLIPLASLSPCFEGQ